MKQKRKNKWIYKRHRITRNILYALLTPYCRIVYGLTAEPFKEQNGRQYVILFNHQTPFDQFFVGMSFKGAVYYLSTEDIFSKGIVSSLIRYLVAPIPIKKQTGDPKAVMTCLRVAREGGTVAIAPEGNRTYSGSTEHINPTIIPLIRKMGLPIALYRIEGGYGVQPRWSDCTRRGKIRSYVYRVIEPEEYETLTNQELFDIVCQGIYVNEGKLDGLYKSDKSAQYIERALYVCPNCGLSEFHSQGKFFTCKKCGLKAEYKATKQLEGAPFEFFEQWYRYQSDFINSLDVTEYYENPAYTEVATLLKVIPYKNKHVIFKNKTVKLYGNRIVFPDGLTIDFASASAAAVLGRNKANFYVDDNIYQIKGNKRFNALKYVNMYYRYKNQHGGQDDKFWGL